MLRISKALSVTISLVLTGLFFAVLLVCLFIMRSSLIIVFALFAIFRSIMQVAFLWGHHSTNTILENVRISGVLSLFSSF